MHDPANASIKKPQWYVTAIFSALAMAFVVTSFQYIPLNFWQPSVLSVGGHTVRIMEFRQFVARKMDLLRTHKYNPGNLKSFLINEMFEEKVLSLEMERLGIRVSKKHAREKLQERFHDTKGRFDESLLRKYRDRYALTVPQMIREEQYRIGVERLRKALLMHVPLHTPLIFLTVKGFFQKRQGYFSVFPFSQEKRENSSPSEKELKEIFAHNAFRAPEYRTTIFFHFSPETIKNDMSVSLEEIEAEVKKMNPHEENLQKKAEEAIRLRKAVKHVEDIFLRMEEDVSAGESIENIAKRYHVPLYTIHTDAKGHAPHGKKDDGFLLEIEREKDRKLVQKEFLQKVFASSKSQDPEWIQTASGDTIFFVVDHITPERDYAYEEVIPLLEKKWYSKKQKEAVIAKVQKISAHMSAQRTPYAQMTKIPPLDLQNITQKKNIPPLVKKALFCLEEKGAMYVYDKKSAYIVFLDHINTEAMPESPDIENGDAREIAYFTQEELQNFFWFCYVESLKKKYPLSLEKHTIDGLFNAILDKDEEY